VAITQLQLYKRQLQLQLGGCKGVASRGKRK